MLVRITKRKHIRKAQAILQKNIEKSADNVVDGNAGFPGGNMSLEFHTPGHGELWSAFAHMDTDTTPRYWNAFGVFDKDKKMQMITVEINIPTQGDSRRVAGYFAKDTKRLPAFAGRIFDVIF